MFRLSWVGLFAGLALHTLIDGVALAASVGRDGIPLDGRGADRLGHICGRGAAQTARRGFSITSIMLAGGWYPARPQVVNVHLLADVPGRGAGVFLFPRGAWAN